MNMMDTGRILINNEHYGYCGRTVLNTMDTGRIMINNEYDGYWQDNNE